MRGGGSLFGRGCSGLSWLNLASPDRTILRTMLRDSLKSLEICLIDKPSIKTTHLIFAIISTANIPSLFWEASEPSYQGWSFLDADYPQ